MSQEPLPMFSDVRTSIASDQGSASMIYKFGQYDVIQPQKYNCEW